MKKQSVSLLVMVVAVQLLTALRPVQAVVLYDGSVGGGTQTPDLQGWVYLSDGTSATQSAAGGVTTLNTTANIAESAGYFNTIHPSMPTLDRTGDGYTVRFDAGIVSETHISNDRAGFSVIALSSDLEGVEIAFWTNEIWAQADSPELFLHGEGAAFDTTAGIVQYDLAILDENYTLYADGSEILQGALRNYSAHTNPVYSTANFLFFGDDTSSAAGISQLAYIEVLDYAVPEPATVLLMGLGALALLRKRTV